MNDDTKLNEILMIRMVPEPSSNLAHRISAAATMPEAHHVPIWDKIFDDIFGMFVIPRPAYALAICLVIGLAVGLQYDTGDVTQSAQDWYSFATLDEGDWL